LTKAEIGADLVFVYRELTRLGLNTGSAGNVSARHGAGMLITPSGAIAEAIAVDSLIEMTLNGAFPPGAMPSSEWSMHAAIYDSAPAAQAIVHTHSDACTALACLGEGLPAFHYMVLSFGGVDVRCAPYATFGTPELATLAATAIEGRTACLLANHGMICHCSNVRAALATAIRLETLARQYLLARTAGTPILLTAEQIAAAQRRFRTYGQTSVIGVR
jgi:L-fuculose-phosphate aldolase